MASKATFYSVGVYQVVMPQRSKAATFFTPNFITEQNAWRPQNLQINSVLILLCFMIELHIEHGTYSVLLKLALK